MQLSPLHIGTGLLLLMLGSPVSAQSLTGLGRIVPPAQTTADSIRVKPGDQVEFRGSSLQSITQVRFNIATAAILVRNSTRIVVAVPPDATIGPVSLYDSFGLVYSSNFSFQVAPRVTGFRRNIPTPLSPADAVRGVPGNSILFAGENFADPGDPNFVTRVQFPSVSGGRVAGLVEFAAPTSMQVKVPANAASGNLFVSNQAGGITTPGRFYLQPFITGFEPGQARVGDTVKVIGHSLLDAISASVGGEPAAILSGNPTNVVLRVPPMDASGAISVTTPGGAFLTSTRLVLLPALDSFTPEGGPVGTVVTLKGSGLAGTSQVHFGSVASSAVTNKSPTEVSAVVPAGAFSAPITVGTPNGSAVSTQLFHVAPTISEFSPLKARVGAVVSVKGQNFTGVSRVEFGSVPATAFTVQETNRLTVVVPDGAMNGPIRVTNPGGTAVSQNSFQLIGTAPLIFRFSPTHAVAGNTVRITGDNLAGTSIVKFNNTATTSFVVLGETNLTVTVPPGATSGKLSVLTPKGTAVSPDDFLVGNTADLSLVGQIGPAAPLPGGTVTLTYQFRNLGPLPADGALLSIGLPSGVEVLDMTTTSGTVERLGLGISVRPAGMPANSLVTVLVRVRVNHAGRLDFVAEGTSNSVDTNPGNNKLTLSVTAGQPALSAVRSENGSLMVSWPESAAGFGLQSVDELTGVWQNWTDNPATTGGVKSVVVTPSGAAKYYRLLKAP